MPTRGQISTEPYLADTLISSLRTSDLLWQKHNYTWRHSIRWLLWMHWSHLLYISISGNTDQLSLAANIPATTHFCTFILHSIMRIHLFLTQETVQVLVQALVISHLLLQLATFAAHSVCSSPAGFQPTQIVTCYTALPLPALATGRCSNQIQDTGHGQTTHPSLSTTLCLLPHWERA